MSQNYYYLVTGLPDLVKGGSKGFDYSKIRQEIIEELSADDCESFKTFLLQFDNANIVNFLNKKQSFDSRGWFSQSEIEDVVNDIDTLPKYLQTFLQDRKEDKDSIAGFGHFEQLSYLYYDEIREKNEWFANWADFTVDVQNAIAAANARELGVSTEKSVIPFNDNAEKIAKSRAADFGLGNTLEWMEQIAKNINDPIALEEVIDDIYWKKADELSEGKTFGIESVLGFMVKANSIERWLRLDTGKGVARANDLIVKLKSQAQK
jgi:hypothetical protein